MSEGIANGAEGSAPFADDEVIVDQQSDDYEGIIYYIRLIRRGLCEYLLDGDVPAVDSPSFGVDAGYLYPLRDEDMVYMLYSDEEQEPTIEDNIDDKVIWPVKNHCRTAIQWLLEGARRAGGDEARARLHQELLSKQTTTKESANDE